MPEAFIFMGPYPLISSDASPGLRFLKAILQALDSLEPSISPLAPFLAPDALFIFNSGEPVAANQIIAMLHSRAAKLDAFHHDMKIAWDVEKGDGRRTVMYESMSVTVHKNDPEKVELKVPEFNIIELVPMEKGFEGLVAVELRSYIGTNPIVQRVSGEGPV
ncbi:hypothetical protein GJ744_009804 [Endocarpon pusillum]|uniref:Uncharacterized protein n=1 Tax=Endocarpon pusillum TaxID=364733 RepID=A0A8H7AQC0_9EURO|nr:hypothetical protein GJ744_009804 [Endocarpon pusillum]